MRTTIRIDDHLLNETKKRALEHNTSISAIIETALKNMFNQYNKYTPQGPVHLPTFNGNGLKHGVDLDDSAALLEIMEGL